MRISSPDQAGWSAPNWFLAQGERHQVVRLVRSVPKESGGEVYWNPEQGTLDAKELEGIAAWFIWRARIWPKEDGRRRRRQRIREVGSKETRLSAKRWHSSGRSRKHEFGFGGRILRQPGRRSLSERSASGDDFLSEVCREWEMATLATRRLPRRESGREFTFRRHLSREGRRAQEDALPYRMGVGGKIGSGEQYKSWDCD